ncbi:glycosyltransferase family 2 protein [Iodobacter sp. LRB]|uniref:glycosyltransferase family 2 protein n=1 Tax=unclassified Iodobacter TaxID=235634 RepID=UPI000C0CC437|nr:glycosyltransferase family 2 protein [Iodobacter sp. BJB302]PHV03093.1 glycosyl transferase [Iodobacter sp. BJB302]
MLKISGLIITFNEAHNIVECLRSMKQVCDDIVVVDSCSSDNTVELARQEGATVISQPFLGDGPQRSAGLPHCRHDWVLNLDADERLEDDLVAYLKNTDLSQQNVSAIETRRRNYIGNQTTRFAGQYPDYVRRIFNKTQVDFSPVAAHTKIQSNSLKQIPAHITHYSYKDYPDIFKRACLYGTWQAQTIAKTNKKIGPFTPGFHCLFSFLKHYVIKLGFLAGHDGLAISLGKAIASYIKYAHAIELRRNKN